MLKILLNGKLILIILISSTILSCSESDYPDPQTLNFTTREGIKTSLDINLEFYHVIDYPGTYYLNQIYYKKSKKNQWCKSDRIKGPWKIFPDQGLVPKMLLTLKK